MLNHYEPGRTTSFVEYVQQNIHDRAALEELFAKISEWAFGIGRSQRLAAHDAEDAAQNAVGKVSRHLRAFQRREGSTFRGWLFTIVAREAQDIAKRRDRVGRGSGDAGVHDQLGNVADYRWDGADDAFAAWARCEALARLRDWKPDAHRVFVATEDEGKDARTVAAEMGVKRTQVYQLRHKAVAFLKDEVRRLAEVGPGPRDQT
jgi:RNA polymerase sigma factor (sigma-70 family)